jgi:hypothetical protein
MEVRMGDERKKATTRKTKPPTRPSSKTSSKPARRKALPAPEPEVEPASFLDDMANALLQGLSVGATNLMEAAIIEAAKVPLRKIEEMASAAAARTVTFPIRMRADEVGKFSTIDGVTQVNALAVTPDGFCQSVSLHFSSESSQLSFAGLLERQNLKCVVR